MLGKLFFLACLAAASQPSASTEGENPLTSDRHTSDKGNFKSLRALVLHLLAFNPISVINRCGTRDAYTVASPAAFRAVCITRAALIQLSDEVLPVTFVNPLEYDGFAEPEGWGTHKAPSDLPLLYFLPGFDGSIFTPFMQYPELGTCFEIRCMRVAEGMDSRASFDDLTEGCVMHIGEALRLGRRVLLVGESFGANLAIAVAHRLQKEPDGSDGTIQEGHAVAGLVLVNPATSFERSPLATLGPVISSLSGVLFPLYPFALLLLAALVLTPAYQAPATLSMIASLKVPAMLCSDYREAFLGRVALSAVFGRRGPGLAIGDIIALEFFNPEAMRFRLKAWLKKGATKANRLLPTLNIPTLTVVGDKDRLLPSVEEAARIGDLLKQRGNSRGVVIVPGAGHASTLGNRLNLMAEIRRAFGKQELPDLRPEAQTPEMPLGEQSDSWAKGMVDRLTPPLDPSEYTRYNKGGNLWPGITSS